MARPKKTIRTDLMPQFMNAAKEERVRALFRAWRDTASVVANEQWRLFFEAGWFDKNHADYSPAKNGLVGTDKLQMVRWQVVGQLSSFMENRANDFRRVVARSSLKAEVKHQLHTVNRLGRWYSREPVAMKSGAEIPEDVRRLARKIIAHVLAGHRRPDMSRVNMMVDQRHVEVQEAAAGAFDYWVRLKLNVRRPGKKAFDDVLVPVKTYAYHEARAGERVKTVQVVEGADGGIRLGFMKDVTVAMEASRAAYAPRLDNLGLDFGLRTLFASSEGDLVGRGFLDVLRRYDRKITALARHRQRMGLKVSCPRYRRMVASLAGYVRTLAGASLERLVAAHAPAFITLERLDFQRPGLSRRMNRILQRCGRSAIRAKLADLEEKYGIAWEEVNPAYTSQACSSCGHVDKNSRDGERFRCTACGFTVHADVNAARNIRDRRSDPIGSVWLAKASVLSALVTRHGERRSMAGAWASPADRPGAKGRPQGRPAAPPAVTSSQLAVAA